MTENTVFENDLNHPPPYWGGNPSQYPSIVTPCSYGKSLITSIDLPAGVIVQKFEGPIVSWDIVEKQYEKEIRNAIWLEPGKWVVPGTDAKYANHSCNPNCIVNENLEIITFRSVKKNEELTFSYNLVDGADPGPWHPRWSFECQCGTKNCQKMIDKYVTIEGKPFISKYEIIPSANKVKLSL